VLFKRVPGRRTKNQQLLVGFFHQQAEKTKIPLLLPKPASCISIFCERAKKYLLRFLIAVIRPDNKQIQNPSSSFLFWNLPPVGMTIKKTRGF
jgi:hypothetical protein